MKILDVKQRLFEVVLSEVIRATFSNMRDDISYKDYGDKCGEIAIQITRSAYQWGYEDVGEE